MVISDEIRAVITGYVFITEYDPFHLLTVGVEGHCCTCSHTHTHQMLLVKLRLRVAYTLIRICADCHRW